MGITLDVFIPGASLFFLDVNVNNFDNIKSDIDLVAGERSMLIKLWGIEPVDDLTGYSSISSEESDQFLFVVTTVKYPPHYDDDTTNCYRREYSVSMWFEDQFLLFWACNPYQGYRDEALMVFEAELNPNITLARYDELLSKLKEIIPKYATQQLIEQLNWTSYRRFSPEKKQIYPECHKNKTTPSSSVVTPAGQQVYALVMFITVEMLILFGFVLTNKIDSKP